MAITSSLRFLYIFGRDLAYCAAALAIQTCPEASTLARFNSVVLHLLTWMTHAI